MPLGIDPHADLRPILEEGQYGDGGEAELVRICAQLVPNTTDQYYVDLNVRVSHPTMGTVFVSGNAFDPMNTRIGEKSGSVIRTFASQLGLNADLLQFDDAPEDAEAKVKRHALLGADPCPIKVIVLVGVNTWKDRTTKEERARNFIKNIWAKP